MAWSGWALQTTTSNLPRKRRGQAWPDLRRLTLAAAKTAAPRTGTPPAHDVPQWCSPPAPHDCQRPRSGRQGTCCCRPRRRRAPRPHRARARPRAQPAPSPRCRPCRPCFPRPPSVRWRLTPSLRGQPHCVLRVVMGWTSAWRRRAMLSRTRVTAALRPHQVPPGWAATLQGPVLFQQRQAAGTSDRLRWRAVPAPCIHLTVLRRRRRAQQQRCFPQTRAWKAGLTPLPCRHRARRHLLGSLAPHRVRWPAQWARTRAVVLVQVRSGV